MTLLIPNSTQVPNFLIDRVMPVVGPAEWKVLSLICRKTYGWQKRQDRISLTQFEQATNLSRPWLVKILVRLTKSGLLVKNGSTRGDIYGLNLECDVVEVIAELRGDVEVSSPINPVNRLTQTIATGSLTSPQLVNTVNTQKPIETNKPKKQPSRSDERDAVDLRHRPICEHIRKRHSLSNEMPLELVPWGAPEGAALKRFLKNSPKVSVEEVCRCVDNYYKSDVNISANPRKWIPSLLEYWVGSMNQYKTPHIFDKEHQRQAEKRAEATVGLYRGASERSSEAETARNAPAGATE